MPQDPASIFGSLLSRCIRDVYHDQDRTMAEGVVFLVLGAFSSVVTTYLLSMAGILL